MEKKELNLQEIYFPHSEIRDEQSKLIIDIKSALENKQHIISHAPTGLGKTAAALAPAIFHAIKNNLIIFFLTSRHTQHMIAIETINKIKRKYDLQFITADIIGKKWMCAMPAVTTLTSSDFVEFCKSVREHDKCEFYLNTRAKNSLSLSVLGKKIVDELNHTTASVNEVIQVSSLNKLCPYEIGLESAKKATIIIADYYYIFNQKLSEKFLRKIGKELKNVIVIVDEAHNLPKRMSELASHKLTSNMIKAAIQEAKKYNYPETINNLQIIQNALLKLSKDIEDNLNYKNKSSNKSSNTEKSISKNIFFELINKEKEYDELIAELTFIADIIKEDQKKSFIGSIAVFLDSWITAIDEKAFARIISLNQSRKTLNNETVLTLSFKCLDPSVMTADIIKNSYSTILMSGTLSPTAMYKDLLGIENCIEKIYQSPFPTKNKLNLIVPITTTKFSLRNDEQFLNIANICAEITDAIPGNSLLFFPSYFILEQVNKFLAVRTKKTIFTEQPGLTTDDKKALLEQFKSYKDSGAVLLAATSGSFGEGIDLPGILKCVIIVGLPLQQPDLETKELIAYFDNKYGKGWEYGYIFPAFQKTLQNAGRCIRNETDKGVIVFLDERYIWPMYYKCFPEDWDIEVKKDYLPIINKFFS